MAVNRFKAADARHIADTAYKYIDDIYASIKLAAEDGKVCLHWTIADVSELLLDNVIKELIEAGYTVKLEHTLRISW